MEKILFFALVIITAGFSNGKSIRDPHWGHDHHHGHHHDGVPGVVMEHLGKTFYTNLSEI